MNDDIFNGKFVLINGIKKRVFFDCDSDGNVIGEVTLEVMKFEGKKEDHIFLTYKKASEIYNQFRAFYSWPKVYSYWNNKEITLAEIEKHPEQETSRDTGEIYQENDLILVKTKEGSISIKKIQLEGKPEMEIKSFLNGYPHFVKSVLK